ncbi:heparin lyase I family protein [Bradyrhizobium sp. BWA-3-5]|uniref:heparin lyase I family protein n=1 Tax=Bradyrhizobium sp. BWA-3-5 TaxID=3080013 RepID=UPI00293F7515|nr:heparin lyase I family protein [Bradyrhizobium sp. BWA-3-5]WOH67866.1 heparin lyase I family protein [Bradyrhizobium sp. BWA-3-5]
MAITSFSPTNGSSLTVDNSKYYVQNANQSWSLQEPNTDTLRFELRSGDHWSSSGYSDPTSAERSEAGGGTLYSAGTQINVSYEFMVEPGATNTAKWIVLGQMHEDSAGYSPPFAVELVNGDHMAIDIGTGSEVYLYKDPNPIERGHYYSMDVQVKFDANGNGFLRVWRDGVQIVDYHGSIGTGAATYWKEGVYRSAAPETMAVNYRNLHITTGAASAPTTPTQPTTPTTPITPPNVAPTVTQASASPGTGIEHAGDTITLTLGFSEAVTVSGTPTLSLNDGAKATYVGGSGTSTLTFKTTVASTDTNTSALAITAVNLPNGASIKDAGGLAANLSGAVKTFSGLQINPIVPAVTQATASPGTGTEHVGDTITLTLGFNEAVTVSGTPTLSLNDGAKATYVGGSGTNSLTFKTTVASTDAKTSALAITGVNLPSGASIKDAGGLAANLSGALKTFSGLQIDASASTPTTPTTPTTPSTPSATQPVLTVADNSLWVGGRGDHVDLGTKVTTTDLNDGVTVTITGLPKYETITDELDGKTFSGNNITLTAAQVNSGLTLNSYYRGRGEPVAILTLTASAKDPSTGAVATASPKTITVTDPPTWEHHFGDRGIAGRLDQSSSAAGSAPQPVPAANSARQPIAVPDPAPATSTLTTSPASQGSALFGQIRDLVANGGVATSASPISAADTPHASGSPTSSLASQSFALLNQCLAATTGRVDPGQIVAGLSNGTHWRQDSFLTRPQH